MVTLENGTQVTRLEGTGLRSNQVGFQQILNFVMKTLLESADFTNIFITKLSTWLVVRQTDKNREAVTGKQNDTSGSSALCFLLSDCNAYK